MPEINEMRFYNSENLFNAIIVKETYLNLYTQYTSK